MIFRESEVVELKETVTDDIKKEIVAFANSDGGTLYIGIRDDGTVLGVENADDISLRISNMVRDSIMPDVTMFIHYETIKLDNREIISVDVQPGTERPYYIAKKGLKPSGVYVRQGYSSVSATDNAIRNMIKETDGVRFEEMRSMEQNLTFDVLSGEFAKRHIPFDANHMKTLKIMNTNSTFTNLGFILSDQCPYTTKLAVFQDNDGTVFKDRREFSGSVMKQLGDIYEYIDFRNSTHSVIEKLYRVDSKDYPEVAVREALLNMIVHRDYSYSSSAFIRMYNDRMEFTSIGGLLPGIELDDILLGLSLCRNKNLGDVFYRLELIEAYGTGIDKIMKAYRNTGYRPDITVSPNAFRITLPNINASSAINDTLILRGSKAHGDYEESVLRLAGESGNISRSDVENLLGVSTSTAVRLLRKMVAEDRLIQIGRARNTLYIKK